MNVADEKIVPVSIKEQMKTAYIDYAMSVIVSRALPDVRDGLKPSHRRILYTMNELGVRASGAHKKSARIVGDVLGKYHPHGDTAIYDAMVRMAQPWSMREVLIDGQGNFGSPDGDGPAAMRYTEARFTRLAEAMLEDLGKDTVDFQPNFDDTLKEPTVLPTRIPQLLVNGASGIAVGLATNMLPHNLGEVIEACLAYIQNKDISIEELMQYVPAPDFPNGGIIYGIEGVKEAMRTGRGKVVLRGRVHIENETNDKPNVVIDEVPYQVSRDALADTIASLVNEKKLEGISDISNQSNKEGTRIVIELKRDAVAEVIINQLYKNTSLQTSFGANNVVLVDGRPQLLNLKELIEAFIKFRHEVVTRRTQFELKEAEKRAHLLKGYLIVLADVDEVVRLIKESENPTAASEGLITKYELTEVQAKAVLQLRLQSLTSMEVQKIQSDYDKEMAIIERCKHLLENEPARFAVIEKELKEVKAQYATPRRSEIQLQSEEMDIRDFIVNEDAVITISYNGYIKRSAASTYRQQRRGGKGVRGSSAAQEDWIEHLFIASTHHTLLFFTQKGRCYWKKVYEIPDTNKGTKGRAVQNFLELEPDDNIRTVIDVPDFSDQEWVAQRSLIFCTRNGIVKKTALKDFSRPRTSGIIAINILEGDQLLDARLTDNHSEILLAVKSGYAVRFHERDVRISGRGATGVRGMNISEGDEVIGMAVRHTDTTQNNHCHILAVSAEGYGKRTPFDAYRLTKRGSKGVKTLNITPKTGVLVGILEVAEGDDLMITCKSGMVIRTAVSAIRETGRNSQGVRLINITEGDGIAAIAKVVALAEEENGKEELLEENENE